MGHKIITEKDYWICTSGAVPAQLQSTQLVTYKQSGEKYITIRDKATSSWIDFGCTKYMLLMALIAALVVVVAVVCVVGVVATGGAALIAIGALAGLAGGVLGAVVGGLLCGQKMAAAREWVIPKSDFKILGADTITGDCTMVCPAGGTVKFAPNIKNWWQALAVGASNYVIKLAESAAVGAIVGYVAPAVVPLFIGGATLAAPTLGSVWANFAGSFGGAFGAFRGLSAIDQLPNKWATGEINSAGDVGRTMLYGGVPEAEFVHRVATGGSVRPSDALLLLYLLNIRAKAPVTEAPVTPRDEPIAPKDEATTPKEEEPATPAGEGNAESSNSGSEGEFEAFEDGQAPGNVPDEIPASAMTGKKPATPEYPVLDAEGNLTDYGKWYYDRPSGFRDGVRDDVWDAAVEESVDGVVRDPTTNEPIDPESSWEMGHEYGYEFRKHRVSAAERGISRKQFMDEHNDPGHYRPESKEGNAGHQGEAPDDIYYGP